jgi:signal peptidase I
MYGGAIVKRCFGMPGDTIQIDNERMKELRLKNICTANYTIPSPIYIHTIVL